MNTWQLMLSTWNFEPSVVFGCGCLLLGYVVYLRAMQPPHSALRIPHSAFLYAAGVGVLLFSLTSPLDTLGDTYLFSAHMLQHLLLVLVVPPLLLLGLPSGVGGQPPYRRRLGGQWSGVAWGIGVGTLWVWHLPVLFDATLRNEWVHVFEHLCFLASATVFWWPIVGPVAHLGQRSLSAPAAAIYLFAASLANDMLGILITFAPPGLYAPYLHPVDWLGVLPLLRDGWGLTPAVDQQVAGLLMWIPGNLVYLAAILAQLARWYGETGGDGMALSPQMEEV
ncbi:MAG: cytochrome c oxidase assembly protein [Chloroflexia bacterium]